MIKTYGCSYTKYHWNTWADFLKISSNQLTNYGIPGASNEIICRNICKTAKKNDTVIVMWSTFDRCHSDIFYKRNNFCEGQYKKKERNQNYLLSTEQLYDRTVEYIWLANKFCEEKNIKILNLSIRILELGETQILQKFKPYLKIDHDKWPIDFDSFCLETLPIIKNIKDIHPSPSQHYFYCQKIICPFLGLKLRDITFSHLSELDKSCKDLYGN